MTAELEENIIITGAREHNLKNIDLTIPRNKLVVITGLSGSGKSSLAFDTIYAEGQRRYMETFSAYARQFLGNMERPDVDQITGLSPVISIEQKTTSRNPRSTVGTITEIYDFVRLLFARTADAFSYVTGEKMVKYSDEQIIKLIIDKFSDKKIFILAPLVKSRKGHYRELFDQIIKQGFLRVRIDGDIKELKAKMQVDRYKTHNIEVVVDKIVVSESNIQRLKESINLSLKMGKGSIMIYNEDSDSIHHYSRFLMCPSSGISYDDPAPNMFSFNSPVGACNQCNGLGEITEADENKIFPDTNLSFSKGGFAPLAESKSTYLLNLIEKILEKNGYSLKTPIKEIDKTVLNQVLYGNNELNSFEGAINFMKRQRDELNSKTIERWVDSFMNNIKCPSCNGSRLKKESLFFKINGMNIGEVSDMSIQNLNLWIYQLENIYEGNKKIIAEEILKELKNRIGFLLDVGLDYLSLNRPAYTLSGGEAQRIRLATQIGSQLVGVLYILDEPSIGLHQRDNTKLIEALKQLRDLGNSLIVVEHDREMIENADYIFDIGPKAGIHGGKISAQGSAEEIMRADTLTGLYLSNKIQIPLPEKRRKGNGKFLQLKGCSGNNLKNISVNFPLGKFVCVTGVSGSGKSTLINETLYPILNQYFYNSVKKPLPYKSVSGIENVDKVIEIDQAPIGRTPRSNPATYTGVFTDIRNLFAELPESKIRGYKPGRFSFNVKGGRCETCMGAGLKTIEMNFLPDVFVHCEDCNGKRYNRETLEIRYHGKSISDVLDMTIDHAVDFFANIPSIVHKIKTIKEVGLGYITLGQSSTTLSGGEAQRIKLATELSKKDTGNTFYILDEPSTGLHFEDIRILLEVLNRLTDNGNTVLVIEHNLDIIKVADHIIDIGPEGGNEGGEIVFEGLPEKLIHCEKSHTGKYLKHEIEKNHNKQYTSMIN